MSDEQNAARIGVKNGAEALGLSVFPVPFGLLMRVRPSLMRFSVRYLLEVIASLRRSIPRGSGLR